MNKYLVLIILLITNCESFAQEQKISNLITPVSYFVNHEKQLKILKDILSKYRQASIVGTSGIGKTQFVRMYAYENNYDIIWFFDCNLDLNEEFVKLAKQLNSIKKTKIPEDVTSAKKEVISYLTHSNKWLLVFDNLKVNGNNKVQDLIDWEHNSNVIFCSQDSENLPNTIEMTLFNKATTIELANNLLDNKDKNDIKFLIESFSGYPILIVQGTQLLNKVKGLDREEYKKKVYQSADKIAINISMAIKELKPSAVKLLNKIALLNNQSFSKQLLTIITDNKDTLDDDIYQLSKFLLISNIDPNENNPIFEMHDVVANKIMEINGNNNKIYLENIISKLPKPKGIQSGQLWRTAKTIPDNLEVLLQNSEKYNIDIYVMLDLRVELFAIYVRDHNLYKAKQMIDWFEYKDKDRAFKLWKMSEYQKYCYARYLGLIGEHSRLSLANFEIAISYPTKALKILDNLNGDYAFLKFNLNSHIAVSQVSLGNVHTAKEILKKMEELFKQGLQEADIFRIYYLKARLFFIQGKYNDALDYIDKYVEVFIKSGLNINHLHLTAPYVSRAEILGYLGRYQEAYAQAKQLYDMHKPIKSEDHRTFGYIYRTMARSELGLGKIDKALNHINKAIIIFLTDEYGNPKNTEYSQDLNLAGGYALQGDILFAQNNIKQAIESYKQAFTIYHYLYKDNSKNIVQVSDLYNHAAKSACKSKDLYNYKFFGKPQIKEFGIHHSNTVDMFEYCKQYNMDLWVKQD
ncbi:tetratricopeptide repeat protein [Candidatus Tisiphia endosymbiont of Micropterix aruncella]|uniref:tetratricopeptide repeat protein n=1 Tax=Candidatus Tisiphia endosymbiont of Micropterix aruncella TaxID=3066271 RepID=UPI003AA80D3F